MKSVKEIKIGDIIYDELYNKIIEEEIEEMDEYSVEDFEEFMFYNGNNGNSLYLLNEGEGYYIDGVMKEWDNIIELLDNYEMLDNIEPKNMTKRKITELFLYCVCDDVVNNYVEELNEKNKELYLVSDYVVNEKRKEEEV